MTSRLIKFHIATHPDLRDRLRHEGVLSVIISNLTTSRSSVSSESPPVWPLAPQGPRGRRPRPSPSRSPVPSAIIAVPGTSPPPHITTHMNQSHIPTAMDDGQSLVALTQFHPTKRSSEPRQSDISLAEGPVIVDDDSGLRVEHRRPRRVWRPH